MKKSNFIILLSTLFPFLGFVQMNLVGVLGNFISSTTITQVQIFNLSVVYVICDALFLIPVGIWLDKFNLKYVITTGIVIFSFGQILFAIGLGRYDVMILARSMMGVGHAFALMSVFRLISNEIKASHQAKWISLALSIAFCGGFFAQEPFAVLLTYLGMQAVFYLLFIISIVLGMVLFANIPNYIQEQKSTNKNFLAFSSVINKNNLLCAFFITILDLPLMVIGALLGVNLLMRHGIVLVQASEVNGMIYVGTIIGAIVFSVRGYRIKNKPSLIIICLSLVIITLILMLFKLNLNMYFLIFFSSGFFSSIQALGYDLVNKMNPANLISSSMAIVNVLLMLFTGLIQFIINYVYKYSYIISIYIIIFFLFLGILFGVGLYRKYIK